MFYIHVGKVNAIPASIYRRQYLWIATDTHGLMAFTVNTLQLAATYLPDKSNPHSIFSNTPRSLYVDKDPHL